MARHCDAAANDPIKEHCDDHSGQLMWMRGIAALLVFMASLLAYSVFWQAPALRIEIAKEIGRVDGDMRLVKRDVESAKEEITDLKSRVGKLENHRR